jgi:amidase
MPNALRPFRQGHHADPCKSGVRIGFSADLGLRRVDPEVAALCEAAVQRAGAMGTAVERAAPDFSGAIDSFQVLRALLFADVRGDLLPAERDRINPDIVWNIEKG